MLTTVAALVIVLGLMVSLARDVRSRSADRLTKDLLSRLDRLMAQYYKAYGNKPPPVTRLIESGQAGEKSLHPRALENNRQFVDALVHQPGLARGDLEGLPLTTMLPLSPSTAASAQVSIAQDFEAAIHDAWGGPIVFMASQHPAIGMAPAIGTAPVDRFFFFSAGPDGRFLTREDNLYSYEASIEELSVSTTRPGKE